MRTQTAQDDTGSLPLAMLLSIVGVGLSVLLMTTTLQLQGVTRVEMGRSAALQAARTGLATALANIRAAKNADGTGLVSKLPCRPEEPKEPHISGPTVDGTARFEATIFYLSRDPGRHDAAWAAERGKRCTTVIPAFAYVVSSGVTAAGGFRRTLFGTYAFKTILKGNMPGGQLQVFKMPGAKHDLCIDAGALPKAGDEVTMQPCVDQPDGTPVARQKFGYQPNLTLSLVAPELKLPPSGLCLDAGTVQAVGNAVTLQACGTTTLIRQQWSFNTASGFFGTSDGKTLNNYCFSVETPDTPDSRLVLNSTAGGLTNGNPACNTNYPNNNQSWNPEPAVGAGAAGLPVTRQLVNFEKFGRCLDITLEDVSVPYEVVFPCKQTPDPAMRDWNQQWDLPADGVGTISVRAPSGRHCLTAPPLNTKPLLVNAEPCSGTEKKDDVVWHVRGADAPTREERYRIEGTGTFAGYCLAPLPEEPAWQQADKAGIEPCTGERIQKWNAQPESTVATFTNIGEL
jgi:hypothetical protein